jgi:galactokinase
MSLMTDSHVCALFDRHFGGEPTVVAAAGGRVNLIGEHTDYNGGEVLPIAIEQRTYVAARANGGTRTQVVSTAVSDRGSFDAASPDRAGAWWDYVAGVALELGLAGRRSVAADVAVWSAVPPGSGLSSSAALEVASGCALLGLSGEDLPSEGLARTAWRAETEFVGVACGIMDQFAIALAREGHALHLRCDTGRFAHVPMPDPVLIFDTRVPRTVRGSAYAARRVECLEALELLRRAHPGLEFLAAATPPMVADAQLPTVLERRARHVVTENERVRAVTAVLGAGAPLPGDILLASHQSLRGDFDCSSPELDWFVERVMDEPGVRGARLTGAGWGGCAIAVGDEDALRAAVPRLEAGYAQRFGRESHAWVTHASGGPTLD